ncbi:element excision factor XisI family protein [Limnofasciculus baicalensis]|uniref:XisI protein n=1 Tax=Limnofasciculus baicalensis BBK-W-15 TaxID=2699891 RepID=A0AAE3GQY3_9CYAN|nr:element excision factor XisI family protein [Limnofasciculus baicalensis]MCP2728208.1 XisI protein [Limnofasciculus baicalensis BBK-W-15]
MAREINGRESTQNDYLRCGAGDDRKMDKLARYRQIVEEMLLEYGKRKLSNGDIEVQTILDPKRDHYQLVHVGWDRDNWVHSCIIHIERI